MFYFDENGIYHAANLRNTLLIIQIIILFFSSGYVFTVAHKVPERKKPRYITIGTFGIIMLIFISIQFFEPYLPLYGIGYMLGTSLLRTFVVENEKEEYRQDLELALEREEKDLEQLNIAWKAAYTDSLTGAQSKLAYSEKEDLLNKAIDEGEIDKFAIAVFDINGLKQINDSLGHDAGDNLIIEAYNLISCSFPDCLIYRIGGDEFVAIMENDNFDKHEKYIANFENMIKHNSENNGVSVAVGHAEYNKEHDSSTRRVFTRADMNMYENKTKMKEEFEKNQKEN
jgi:diguanylate cyclase (GGDEF)-like protein